MFNTMVSDNIQSQILMDIAKVNGVINPEWLNNVAANSTSFMEDFYAFASDRLEQDNQDMIDFDNALNKR